MMDTARNAGARRRRRWLARVVVALSLGPLTLPPLAAQARLLHVGTTTVRGPVLSDGQGGQSFSLQFTADGVQHDLRLQPNQSLQGWSAQLAVQALAYQGEVGDRVGSWAAVTRIGQRWTGMWFDGAEYYGIDTAAALAAASSEAAAAPPDSQLVFRLRDAVWEDKDHDGDAKAALQDGAQLMGSISTAPVLLAGQTASRVLKVALVADVLLAAQDGTALEGNLLAQLNIIDSIFASQTGVRVVPSSITIYADGATEPFTASTDADALLEDLAQWRHATSSQREAGATHLFTGRNLDGRTVGMAYMKTLCSSRYSASLSQATDAPTLAALIAAHELGHVFGAPHDGETGSACATTPIDYLMASRINGSQTFSSCSLDQIAPQVAAASCLTTLAAGTVPDVSPLTTRVTSSPSGGGGALGIGPLAALVAMAATRGRRRWRALQMRANQSDR